MLKGLALGLVVTAGVAQAALADPLPGSGEFDLAQMLPHPEIHGSARVGASRWLTHDLAPPPGPPHDPPLLRIRGKKVKMKLRF